ncbi:MAG TPA: hypothetical protein VIF62_22610 [Labilithrix sp.]|jgi:mono/diheme cytochrome c family protein
MRSLLSALLLASAAAVIAACSSGTDAGGESSSSDSTSAAPDLPCDVAAIVSASCVKCHGATLANGAPMHLLRQEDFAAPSRSDGAVTVAHAAVFRLKDPTAPMPPTGALPASDVATIEAWVNAGLPKGTCSADGR